MPCDDHPVTSTKPGWSETRHGGRSSTAQKCTCGRFGIRSSSTEAVKPYEVAPRADRHNTPFRRHRVHIRRQVPVAISPIVGDIVHIRLDSLAYEMAVRQVGRPLTDAQLKA